MGLCAGGGGFVGGSWFYAEARGRIDTMSPDLYAILEKLGWKGLTIWQWQPKEVVELIKNIAYFGGLLT